MTATMTIKPEVGAVFNVGSRWFQILDVMPGAFAGHYVVQIVKARKPRGSK